MHDIYGLLFVLKYLGRLFADRVVDVICFLPKMQGWLCLRVSFLNIARVCRASSMVDHWFLAEVAQRVQVLIVLCDCGLLMIHFNWQRHFVDSWLIYVIVHIWLAWYFLVIFVT